MPLVGEVRSPTGALGSPQNRAGLEDDFGRILQKDHSQADRLQFHCVCLHIAYMINSEQFIFRTQVGRKRRLSLLLLGNFCLC